MPFRKLKHGVLKMMRSKLILFSCPVKEVLPGVATALMHIGLLPGFPAIVSIVKRLPRPCLQRYTVHAPLQRAVLALRGYGETERSTGQNTPHSNFLKKRKWPRVIEDSIAYSPCAQARSFQMKVIEPTPSQAAVVMKNYLRSLGFEVSLANAQECFARSRGYADWNTLASQVDVRGKKTKAEAPVASTAERYLTAPFTVFVNGGYYDTVAYYEQATSLAEVITVMEDEERTEPFDCVTIQDALGNTVDRFIQAHTRIRVYADDGLWTTFPDTGEDLNRALALLTDHNRDIRVEEYTLKVDLGIVGITDTIEPQVIYERSASEVSPVWRIEGDRRSAEEAGAAIVFDSLDKAKAWFHGQAQIAGVSASIQPTMAPMEDLHHWVIEIDGYPKSAVLTRVQ
jgi:hypothetical protein